MAIVSVPQYQYPALFPTAPAAAPTAASFGALNVDGDKVAFIVRAPKAGVLDWFEVQVAAVSNNPDNGVRFSFQGVDDTNGNPDGTQDEFRDVTGTEGTISTGWLVPAGVMTSDGSDSGTKRTVAANEAIACVLEFVTFVAGDSIQFSQGLSGQVGSPFADNYSVDGSTGTFTTKSAAPLAVALKYADGSYAQTNQLIPSATVTSHTTFNSGSTPDERGARFEVPMGMSCAGAWVLALVTQPCDVVLYGASGNVLGTASIDPDIQQSATSRMRQVYWDDGPVTLTAGTVYRVVLKPTTTSNVTFYSLVVSAARLAAFTTGATFYGTTRADAGAWTDSQTEYPLIGLLIDGIEGGSSGGGGNSGGAVYMGQE